MNPDEFAHKLMMTESEGRPEVWGDDGRAIGLWQVHPDWVFSVARLLGFAPLIDERWNDFIGKLVRGFFNYYTVRNFTPVQIAMHFHIGHVIYEGASAWDENYAERFNEAPSV